MGKRSRGHSIKETVLAMAVSILRNRGHDKQNSIGGTALIQLIREQWLFTKPLNMSDGTIASYLSQGAKETDCPIGTSGAWTGYYFVSQSEEDSSPCTLPTVSLGLSSSLPTKNIPSVKSEPLKLAESEGNEVQMSMGVDLNSETGSDDCVRLPDSEEKAQEFWLYPLVKIWLERQYTKVFDVSNRRPYPVLENIDFLAVRAYCWESSMALRSDAYDVKLDTSGIKKGIAQALLQPDGVDSVSLIVRLTNSGEGLSKSHLSPAKRAGIGLIGVRLSDEEMRMLVSKKTKPQSLLGRFHIILEPTRRVVFEDERLQVLEKYGASLFRR